MGKFAPLRDILLLEAFTISLCPAHIENLMLPILLVKVNQILDHEAHTGVNLHILPLLEHPLQTLI